VPPKNHEAVVRAAARLGARVELIGRGPSQAAIQALAERLGVPLRVRTGLPGPAVVASYQQASVVVCPSRFEGLGLTGIEAAVCGAPVVASDIAPHREFLGDTPHYFTLDDDDSLVTAIEAARLADPPTAHFATLTIAAAARRFYDELSALL
jgi:glycosyltransferase involved in cell wall biosynthesis